MVASSQVQCMGSPHCSCHRAVARRGGGCNQNPYLAQPEFGKSACFKLGLELARHWKLSELLPRDPKFTSSAT